MLTSGPPAAAAFTRLDLSVANRDTQKYKRI